MINLSESFVDEDKRIDDDVWIEPGFRKVGMFSAILKELVGFAEKKGAQDLIVEYSLANKEAQTAWTRLGFKTTGVCAAALITSVKQALADRP